MRKMRLATEDLKKMEAVNVWKDKKKAGFDVHTINHQNPPLLTREGWEKNS